MDENHQSSLAYDESKDFDTWREQVREKLTELLGDIPMERCDLNIWVEWEKEHETFYEKRMLFNSEANVDIPCHLWIPKNVKLPCPVVICLQGHTSGMHISMGRTVYPEDAEHVSSGDRNLAVQAIENGYAALVMELRGFGELACLIAPRPLVMVAGVTDIGFHIDGSREVAGVAQKIYDKMGVSDKFRFIEGPEGHRYYAALSWPVVHELFD